MPSNEITGGVKIHTQSIWAGFAINSEGLIYRDSGVLGRYLFVLRTIFLSFPCFSFSYHKICGGVFFFLLDRDRDEDGPLPTYLLTYIRLVISWLMLSSTQRIMRTKTEKKEKRKK